MSEENESVFDAPTVSDTSTVQNEPQNVPSSEPAPDQQQSPQGGPTSAPPADPNKAITDAIQQGFASIQQRQPQQQQQPLSEEEVKKRLKEYSYGEDYAEALIAELRAETPDKKAIAALLNSSHQAAMQQAQTYAFYLMQHMAQQLQGQFQPAVQYATQAQKQASQDRFFKAYPALKNFEKLMPLVANQVAQSGMQFHTEEQTFQALAAAAEAHIQTLQPAFKLGAQTQQAQKQGATTPNTVSFGGQGGAGNAPPAPARASSGIWD